MAKVVKQGQALIDEIAAAQTAPGTLAFWWLGQNGFVFKGGGRVIYIDPYLAPSPSRRTPPPLSPEEVTNADLILGSHDHSDHVDRLSLPAMLAASPRARLVVSRVVAANLGTHGYSTARLVGINDGETVNLDGVQVTGVRAAHEFFDQDPALGYPHLGFVVRMNGVSFFHAGDGVPWEGLISTLAPYSLDALFVPINGRDAKRYRGNCIGNFTFQEAVDLVGSLHPKLAVPMHWDMFAHNSEDPARFVDYLDAKYPGIPAWVGAVGEQALIDAR